MNQGFLRILKKQQPEEQKEIERVILNRQLGVEQQTEIKEPE